MHALLKCSEGDGNVVLKEVPDPTPATGEAVIRVQRAALCGTDIHIFHDRFKTSPPLILGHEFSGVVEAIGPGVKNVKLGDRVVSENNPYACGTCRLCTLGYPNLCPAKRAMGILSDGCFADYVRLPAHLLHLVPQGVSPDEASLSEPLAVATHAVWGRTGISHGDTVVVFGPGAIGLLAAQVARAEGAGKVFVVGTKSDAIRFECAEQLGFETLRAEEANISETVMAFTSGVGADVVVEASGSPHAVREGIRLLRKNGRMAVSGITGRPEIAVDWNGMVTKAISLHFSYSSRPEDWEKAMEYLKTGAVQTLPLITHRLPLSEWRKAFSLLEELQAIRVVFTIDKEST